MILPGFFDACDRCGEPFEREETYPVLATDEEGDGMRLFSFCDDECLEGWTGPGESADDREDDEAEA